MTALSQARLGVPASPRSQPRARNVPGTRDFWTVCFFFSVCVTPRQLFWNQVWNQYCEHAEFRAGTIRDYTPRVGQMLDFFRETEGIEPDVKKT